MSFDFGEFSQKAVKLLEYSKQQISQLRTGRAAVQLLDPVVVEAYGTTMKLQELATISVVDAQLLLISPWDKSLLSAIERAIVQSSLNMQAIIDKDAIRVPVPPLTEERRREMVKILHKTVEEAKAHLRVLRTETKRDIEAQKGQDGVSEDDIELELEDLDERIKTYVSDLEKVSEAKEKDLMTV